MGYGPIVLILVIGVGMAAVIMLISHLPAKWHRHGKVKDMPYESGMEPIGDARGRFNVRFYLVAMLFLLFDVELIFMYPWAVAAFNSSTRTPATPDWASPFVGGTPYPTFLFGVMGVFFLFLLIGLAYEWRKGIFRWD